MVQVKVREGLLEGELVQNEYGGSFFSFKGIPYAEPPIGDLRFKAPHQKKPWSGVRMAKEHGSHCIQQDIFMGTPVSGSEDCLYLNVYTPDLNPNKPLPVMFWIHGGAFLNGRGNHELYGPEFLIREDVILVTFNYRLGVLGFLCLDTEDIPGNAGMKDQVAALRWVKENISNFGGDTNNVTIFGQSAGGGSVSYHLISPMSKGLFKRAIAQSGVAINSWTQSLAPRERAIALARKLGFKAKNDKKLYEFFKSQPVENLINANVPITLTEEGQKRSQLQYNIVIEKKFNNIERFLYEDPYDAMRNGIHQGVQVMSGYTEHEGLLELSLTKDIASVIEQANKFPEYFVPQPIALKCKMSDQLDIGKRFRKFYFADEEVSMENLEKLIKFISADMFIYGIIEKCKICAKRNYPIYLYKFTCKSERNLFSKIRKTEHFIEGKSAVGHTDDLPYFFPFAILVNGQKVDQNSNTFRLIERSVKLWTNFVKYGNPTPDGSLGVTWKPYSLQQQNYLDIGNELVPGTAPDDEEVKFWEDIYRQYLPHYIAEM